MFSPSDAALADLSLSTLPLLERLRRERGGQDGEVCLERVRHLTTYLRDLADRRDPHLLQYAKAVRCFLSNRVPRFHDDNLLAGTLTSRRWGTTLDPEQLSKALPIAHLVAARSLTAHEAVELSCRLVPYWQRAATSASPCLGAELAGHVVAFLAAKGRTGAAQPGGWVQGVLERGLAWFVHEAATEVQTLRQGSSRGGDPRVIVLRAVREVLVGVMTYAENLAKFAALLAAAERDAERAKRLAALAEVCTQIPTGPARTFREAVSAVWLLHLGLHSDSAPQLTALGRLDQILHPWFERDVEAGRLTPAQALELLGCLWLKFNEGRTDGAGAPPLPGAEATVTLGGLDVRGENAVNPLSYLFLRTIELMDLPYPSVSLRYHDQRNPPDYIVAIQALAARARNAGGPKEGKPSRPVFQHLAASAERIVFSRLEHWLQALLLGPAILKS